MIDRFTGPLSLDLYPPPPNARADTLAIKQTIAQLMSEADGLNYWNLLTKFLKGKLDRNEFESNTTSLLSSQKLIGLHNALILSIIYNSTRSELPSNQAKDIHTTGHGWAKRKRTTPPSPPPPLPIATATKKPPNARDMSDHKNTKEGERDLKKRKLKHAVLALGQRERNRIKEIATASNLFTTTTSSNKNPQKSLVENHHQQNSAQLQVFNPNKYLAHQRTPNVLNTPLASKMKISSSTLYQDYMRCQGALVCSESRQLPDFDTLKDRMSLIAYDSGLINGVEKSASSLALIGLEVHLKTLLGDLLSLIRPDRSVSSHVNDPSAPKDCDKKSTELVNQPNQTYISSTSHQPTSTSEAATNDLDPSSSSNVVKPTPVTLIHQSSSNLRLRDMKTQGLAPHLTSRDVAALAEISPHAFVRTHSAALERLMATPSTRTSPTLNHLPTSTSSINLNSSRITFL